jgi:hypothetical protein
MNQQKKNHQHAATALAIVRKHFPQVKEVLDAVKPVTIEVNHSDASSKAVKNPLICAFAKACERTFTADGVIIGLTTSYIIKGKIATRYRNPETVSREIVSFDRKAGFEEGTYLLSAISPAQRLGAEHRGGKYTGKGTRRFHHTTTNVRVLA